jgi:hypothetical protein
MLLQLLLAAILMPARTVQKEIGPGMTYIQDSRSEPPMVIHILQINPKMGAFSIKVGLGGDGLLAPDGLKGRESVNRIASRYNAVAALNGDFFPWTGDPLGMCIIDGELASEPARNRVAFGWKTDGSYVVGNPTFSASAYGPANLELKIQGINRECGAGENVLWLPNAGSRAVCSKKGTAAIFRGLNRPVRFGWALDVMVAEVRKDVSTVSIPADGAVLFIRDSRGGPLIEQVASGGVWKLLIGVTDSQSWDQVVSAIGGGPWLVKNKAKFIDAKEEGFPSNFSTVKHPRSAIGHTADGTLLMVAVEGRSESSSGVTLDELADILINLGAVNAINLDGGGSTDMVVRGIQVTNPSDGAVRPVANAVLVISAGEVPVLENLRLEPKVTKVKTGDTIAWSLVDPKSGKPVPNEQILWGTTPGPGRMDQFGGFTAVKQGLAVVSAFCRGNTIRSIVLIEPKETPANASSRQKK